MYGINGVSVFKTLGYSSQRNNYNFGIFVSPFEVENESSGNHADQFIQQDFDTALFPLLLRVP